MLVKLGEWEGILVKAEGSTGSYGLSPPSSLNRLLRNHPPNFAIEPLWEIPEAEWNGWYYWRHEREVLIKILSWTNSDSE